VKKVLIIGGGPAGCAAAHQISLLGGYDILIIEASSRIGGGCKTMTMGGHPYTFGPRHFLTEKRYLFDFLNKFVPMRSCQEHEFKTYVEQDDDFYNFPITEVDIKRMPDYEKITKERKEAKGPKDAKNLEEYWYNSVGPTLYKKFIQDYNKKMWMVNDVSELDTFNWSPRGPSIASGEKKVFHDRISAYPIKLNGYDDYWPIATNECKVLLNTTIESYDIEKKEFVIKGDKMKFDIVVSTISPDVFFNSCHGKLPYLGRDFYPFILPVEEAFPKDVYFLYYAGLGKVTRCVEYKKLTRYKSKNTLLGVEIPSLSNELYPLPIQKWINLAEKYCQMMPEGVYSVGRKGVYRYGLDFDRCIDHGMIVAKDLKSGGGGKGSALSIDPTGQVNRVAQ
jgi:UDP-galactopyranose mutase